MTTLHNLYVPLITPFDETGRIDLGALEQLAHDTLDAGAHGLVALGTTAEPATLTPAEHTAVLDLLSTVSHDRGTPLLAGAHDTAALHALATQPAVTGALTLVPPFLRPGADGVIAHLTALAATSPVPLVVYHVPHRTGQPLTAAALHRIAAIPNVAGLKHAPGGIDNDTIALMGELPPGFAVLGGDDTVIAPLLALGAPGAILASAHIATTAYAGLITAWRTGDTHRARPLGHHLARLSAALFAEPNPTVIKGVLHAQGRIPTPAVRLPLLPAAQQHIDAALAAATALTHSCATPNPTARL